MPVPFLPQRAIDDGRLRELDALIQKWVGTPKKEPSQEPRHLRAARVLPPRVREVIKLAAEAAGVPFLEILGGGPQHKHVVFARRTAIYELRKMGYSLCGIGNFMNLDHSSVLHHIRKREKELAQEANR